MIINIQNVSLTSRISCADLAAITGTEDYTARLDAYYFRDCLKSALCTAAVTVDRTVRGVCVCKGSMIPDSCEIDVICIDREFRRIGLGRKLLSHSLRNMRTLRVRKVYLWVNESNEAAVSFFTHFGFKPDGKRRASQGVLSGGELRFKIDIY